MENRERYVLVEESQVLKKDRNVSSSEINLPKSVKLGELGFSDTSLIVFTSEIG
jgi:hypothetical protein